MTTVASRVVVAAHGGPRPLRVAFYDHCARMSGAEISMRNTIAALPTAEAVVVLGEHGPLAGALTADGVDVRILPLPTATAAFSRRRIGLNLGALVQPLHVLRYAVRLARELRTIGPDVIVSNSMKSHVILAAAAPLLPAPVVFHLHDRVSTDFMSASGVRLERLVLRATGRGVVANSQSTMDTVPVSARHRVRVLAGGPIAPLPDGVAVPEQPATATRFGMVGRLTPWKGQDLALRAFASAFPDGPQTVDIVGGPLFGETEYEASLRRLAVDLGLGDRVRFAGHVDDVTERMRGWHVLVHASVIPEPFGLVVAQGMLAGLPVIASGEGGPAEMIEHGTTGWLVEPRSETALAERLRAVAVDQPARVSASVAARVAAARWLAPQVAETIEDALRVAAAAPAR